MFLEPWNQIADDGYLVLFWFHAAVWLIFYFFATATFLPKKETWLAVYYKLSKNSAAVRPAQITAGRTLAGSKL